ncbi:MAG: DUF3322 domain-containing protein [Candidatus Accumulibacter delftensis]
MSWTRPAGLRAQVQKLWDRGDVLASLVSGEPLFPRRLLLKGPTSAEMAERFDAVRAWVAELRAMPHCRIEMREFRHRVFGANAVPHEAWVDSLDDALALIGKRRDVARFNALVELTRQRQPQLLAWLAKRPLRALELAGEWSRLLAIVAWVAERAQQAPRPGVYLRQVDIPGVHSKFIEAHRGVLAEWLDLVLPAAAIDASATGVSGFARRYGFATSRCASVSEFSTRRTRACPSTSATTSLSTPPASPASIPRRRRVFITENEINFLAFPAVSDSLILFGAGYGFEMLAQAQWLSRCRIHYWGDIDTHGFAILDQLRAHFAHVDSFLMDRATLLAFQTQWGEEDKQTLRELPRLNEEERALYDDLRDNRLGKNLRLEQERIGFGWVEEGIRGIEGIAALLASPARLE